MAAPALPVVGDASFRANQPKTIKTTRRMSLVRLVGPLARSRRQLVLRRAELAVVGWHRNSSLDKAGSQSLDVG
eukprot:9047796-Pyramimonas_sp.AAC.1